MRIHLKTKSIEVIIPYNHQRLLVGAIHKWIGKGNEEHGDISLYSFSRLNGAKNCEKGLAFQHGSTFFFSAHDLGLIQQIIHRIQKDPILFDRLEIEEIIIQEEPDLESKDIYFTASPILIKHRDGDNIRHLTYKDSMAPACLEHTLKTKMNIAGLIDDSLKIEFIPNHPSASTKLVNYNGINNRSNWCPLLIMGKPETKVFAWNVGLGNSTGIGFGAIK